MSNQDALADFKAATASFPETMAASLTYIALTDAPEPHVVKARLHFHGAGTALTSKSFKSEKIIAERFTLAEHGLAATDVISAVFDGKLPTPQGEFAFLPQITGGVAATFIPLHPEVLAQQTRTGVLQIRGSDQSGHWQNLPLDWTLRSADSPYDNLDELAIDFGLGPVVEPSSIFEAVAGSIIAVDLSHQVEGETARIGVFATKGLDRSQISIGYRILDKGLVATRHSVTGTDLEWSEEEARDVGSTQIAVPPASLVNCYARYQGVTYHSGFIVDPQVYQNARRSAYEVFDPDLKDLVDLLQTRDKKRSRDLEAAVASLLWMLGFNTCHLGGTKLLQDGPDILATTPEGHVIVVECTMGMLKAESKMPKLLARTVAVREQLAKSGHNHLRVLPVMLTTLSTEEIASEIGDAVSNGVYVLAADDFPEAITRTLIPPHADQLFTQAEQGLLGLLDGQP